MAQPTPEGVTLNSGSGGVSLAVETVASKVYPAGMVVFSDGASGVTWVTSAAPLPVVANIAAAQTLATVTTVGTVSTVTSVTDVAKFGGQAVTMGTGERDAGTQRVTIATNDAVPVTNSNMTNIAGAVYADGDGWTDGMSSHMLAGGIYQASPQTIADDDSAPVQLTVNGYQIVTVNGTVTVVSGTHDNLKANATVQMQDADVTAAAPLQVQLGDGTTQVTVDTTSGGLLVAMYDTSGNPILNSTAVLGTDTYSEASTVGTVVGAVRNDDLATLADTDNETAPLQVDAEGALYVNDTESEVKRDSGVAAGSGADQMIAAVGSRYIRVLAMGLFATSATVNNAYVDNVDNDLLFNAANPLALSTGPAENTVAGFILPYNRGGWFETDAVNEAVTLTSDAAQDIAWTITWIEVL